MTAETLPPMDNAEFDTLEAILDDLRERDDEVPQWEFCEGAIAALHFALRARGVLHAWFIAHEPAFERYSPGVILIDHILRWASDQGIREVDLGPGDYRFKLQLANRTRDVAHGFVGRPSPAALVRGAHYRLRAAAEALPLGALSELPGKAMRRLDVISGLRA